MDAPSFQLHATYITSTSTRSSTSSKANKMQIQTQIQQNTNQEAMLPQISGTRVSGYGKQISGTNFFLEARDGKRQQWEKLYNNRESFKYIDKNLNICMKTWIKHA